MFTDPGEHAAVVFAGSRHPELRSRTFDALFSQAGPLRVFLPSYTVYEYSAEELAAFIANSEISIVNKHEAAFLGGVLGDAAVMGRAVSRALSRATRAEQTFTRLMELAFICAVPAAWPVMPSVPAMPS